MAREFLPADRMRSVWPPNRLTLLKDADAPGRGELRVRAVAGESAVVTAHSNSPLKILVPIPRGPSISAYFSSYGGGLVAGDEIHVNLDLEAGTRAYLGTQSSTKVYRNPGFLPCGHTLTAELGEESVLVLAPDPVQAFRGAIYRQRQEFHLQPGSGLVVLDWFTSGRTERGERWAFTRYESHNQIFVAGKRTLVDSLVLDPLDGPIEGPCRMDRYNCFALLALFGGAVGQPAAQILEEIGRRPISPRSSLVCGASPVPGGAVVRIVGEQVEQVRHEVNRLLDFLPELLQDDPRSRKW